MKVWELIDFLSEYDREEEIKFWVSNLNSSKREDMQTEFDYIEYKDDIIFCDSEREYPRYSEWSGVYVKFKDPRYCDKSDF